MDMQDKEFDQLFRSKLGSFEITPSANVWEGISDQLEAGKRKRLLVPFLSIAASIIVLATAGILFIPKLARVSTQAVAKNPGVKTKGAASNIAIAKTKPLTAIKTPVVNQIQQIATAVNPGFKLRPIRTKKDITPVRHLEPTAQKQAPIKANEQPMLAATEAKQDVNAAVVPDNDTPIAIKQPVAENSDFLTKPALVATQLPVVPKQDDAPVKKKHKIRSLGDLINVVVAKVDKRKDKLIEFTDGDDDESNITGVNLGIIKVKK